MAAIDLSTLSAVGVAILTGYAALTRFGLNATKREIEGKIEAVRTSAHSEVEAARSETGYAEERARSAEGQAQALNNRLHEEEKATIRQDGEIKLLQQTRDNLTKAIEELRTQQVPRAEWERQNAHLEKQLVSIAEKIDRQHSREMRAVVGSQPTRRPDPRGDGG